MFFGLDGSIARAQKPKEVKTYATQQPGSRILANPGSVLDVALPSLKRAVAQVFLWPFSP